MLTPQELQEKQFSKAVFGGYDMADVNAFRAQVEQDYADLCKENAILKSKIKVLVEKVEEYRATEDSMRMALLTAQKMGDELVSEAAKEKSTIIAAANEELLARKAHLEAETEAEQNRLDEAKAAVNEYTAQMRVLMGQLGRSVAALETASYTEHPVPAAPAEKAAPEAPAAPAEAEPPASPAETEAAAQTSDRPILADEVLEDPDVAQILAAAQAIAERAAQEEEAAKAAEAPAEPASPAVPVDPDDDEPVTPRPKFDFDDLKFGTNFDE